MVGTWRAHDGCTLRGTNAFANFVKEVLTAECVEDGPRAGATLKPHDAICAVRRFGAAAQARHRARPTKEGEGHVLIREDPTVQGTPRRCGARTPACEHRGVLGDRGYTFMPGLRPPTNPMHMAFGRFTVLARTRSPSILRSILPRPDSSVLRVHQVFAGRDTLLHQRDNRGGPPQRGPPWLYVYWPR